MTMFLYWLLTLKKVSVFEQLCSKLHYLIFLLVWLPDVALTNSADHLYSISRDFRFVVRVTSNGQLKYVPTGTARTWCSLRLLTFPFDLQTVRFAEITPNKLH